MQAKIKKYLSNKTRLSNSYGQRRKWTSNPLLWRIMRLTGILFDSSSKSQMDLHRNNSTSCKSCDSPSANDSTTGTKTSSTVEDDTSLWQLFEQSNSSWTSDSRYIPKTPSLRKLRAAKFLGRPKSKRSSTDRIVSHQKQKLHWASTMHVNTILSKASPKSAVGKDRFDMSETFSSTLEQSKSNSNITSPPNATIKKRPRILPARDTNQHDDYYYGLFPNGNYLYKKTDLLTLDARTQRFKELRANAQKFLRRNATAKNGSSYEPNGDKIQGYHRSLGAKPRQHRGDNTNSIFDDSQITSDLNSESQPRITSAQKRAIAKSYAETMKKGDRRRTATWKKHSSTTEETTISSDQFLQNSQDVLSEGLEMESSLRYRRQDSFDKYHDKRSSFPRKGFAPHFDSTDSSTEKTKIHVNSKKSKLATKESQKKVPEAVGGDTGTAIRRNNSSARKHSLEKKFVTVSLNKKISLDHEKAIKTSKFTAEVIVMLCLSFICIITTKQALFNASISDMLFIFVFFCLLVISIIYVVPSYRRTK